MKIQNILFLFFILIVLYNSVNSAVLYFQPNNGLQEGSWLDELNWTPNQIPGENDQAVLGNVNNLVCNANDNSNSKLIIALKVNVGLNSNIATLRSSMSQVSIGQLWILNSGSNVVFTNNASGVSLVNVLTIVVQNGAKMVSSASRFENQLLLIEKSQVSFESSKFVQLNDISLISQSILSLANSNVVILDGDIYPSNISNSIVSISNSNSSIYGDLNLFLSNVQFINSKVNIYKVQNVTNQRDIIQLFYSLQPTIPGLDIQKSQLSIGKNLLTAYTLIQINSSYVEFKGILESYETAILSVSSVLDFNEPVSFLNNSIISAEESSIVNFNSEFYLVRNSSVSLTKSEANIKSSDGQVFELTEDSFFFVFNNSKLNVKSSCHNYDTSRFGAISSTVSIGGNQKFYDSSVFIAQNSKVSIEKDYILNDYSTITSLGSEYSISGSLIMNNHSSIAFYESNVLVNGLLLDNTLGVGSSNGQNTTGGFMKSNVFINGIFKVYGFMGFINSSLELNNEFINYGTIVYGTSEFIIRNGNLLNYGGFHSESSSIVLEDGYIFLYPGSIFGSLNSTFTLYKGELMVGENVIFKFKNSTLYNYNQGLVKIQGDIILEIDGYVENNSTMVLYSNVLPNNTSGNENFLNQGKLLIVNDDGSSNGGGKSNIMVPLFNHGSIVIGDKELNVFELKQASGGDLNLNNNSIINSNKTITIESSFINGNGVINTSIEFSNAFIGNNPNNDKIVTQLNITGEFKSSQDQINFIIQSESNSSLISINNDAIINNSTIIVKINIKSIGSLSNKNLTLMNFNSLIGDSFGLVNGIGSGSENELGDSIRVGSGSGSGSGTSGGIKFKFYNPDTNEEEDIEGCAELNTQLSSKSLSLLIGNTNKCLKGKSKLSTGAIIGIVIGVAAFSILVGVLVKLKSNWFYLRYYSIKKFSIELKQKK